MLTIWFAGGGRGIHAPAVGTDKSSVARNLLTIKVVS